MSTSKNSHDRTLKPLDIPQDSLGKIILMFAWPAAWFTVLIYGIGRQFIPDGGSTPTWMLLLVIVLGTGAELFAVCFSWAVRDTRFESALSENASAGAGPKAGKPGHWPESCSSWG